MEIALDNVISDVGSGINCRKKGLKIDFEGIKSTGRQYKTHCADAQRPVN